MVQLYSSLYWPSGSGVNTELRRVSSVQRCLTNYGNFCYQSRTIADHLKADGDLKGCGGIDTLQVLQVQEIVHVVTLNLLALLCQRHGLTPRLARLELEELLEVGGLALLAVAGEVHTEELELLEVCLKHRLLKLAGLDLLLLLEGLDHRLLVAGDGDGGDHGILRGLKF